MTKPSDSEVEIQIKQEIDEESPEKNVTIDINDSSLKDKEREYSDDKHSQQEGQVEEEKNSTLNETQSKQSSSKLQVFCKESLVMIHEHDNVLVPALSSNDTVDPSYTNLFIPYSILCRRRYRKAAATYKQQLVKEIQVHELLRLQALDGVRIHRTNSESVTKKLIGLIQFKNSIATITALGTGSELILKINQNKVIVLLGVFVLFPSHSSRKVKNGHIRRVIDDEVKSLVLDVGGTNVATTYITCPIKPRASLGVKLPYLVMVIKNMKKYFSFEIQILDDKEMRRRFRVSNFQSTTKVRPFCTTMPIGLSAGWNQVQFNLADFTKRAYGSVYMETIRVQIHANVRIRRIYFTDQLHSDEDLPNEFKLFAPGPRDKKHKGKKASKEALETAQAEGLVPPIKTDLKGDEEIPPPPSPADIESPIIKEEIKPEAMAAPVSTEVDMTQTGEDQAAEGEEHPPAVAEGDAQPSAEEAAESPKPENEGDAPDDAPTSEAEPLQEAPPPVDGLESTGQEGEGEVVPAEGEVVPVEGEDIAEKGSEVPESGAIEEGTDQAGVPPESIGEEAATETVTEETIVEQSDTVAETTEAMSEATTEVTDTEASEPTTADEGDV